MRGLFTFPPGIGRAADFLLRAVSANETPRVWLALAMALIAAALDRFSVICVTDALLGRPAGWRDDIAWAVAAIAVMVLAGRWSRTAALGLADRSADSLLTGAVRALQAADWRSPGRSEALAGLARCAAEVREAAAQVAVALPSIAVLPVTVVLLAVYQPLALAVAALLAFAGGLALQQETVRVRAAQTVLADAEAAFEAAADRLLAAGPALQLAGGQALCGEALWPAVDDATRAASIHAGAHARLAGVLSWLGFVTVIALLALLPSGEGEAVDRGWIAALVLVAATLHSARRAAGAWLALERVGAAVAQVDAIGARFPPVTGTVPFAPARWTAIAFREAKVEAADTPDVFLPAIGPLEMELRRGEIVAVTGSNPHDRATLLHMICGLVPLAWGAVQLDGRMVPPATLRGLCGGVLDRVTPAVPVAAEGSARAAVLLARFDLSAGLLARSPGDPLPPPGELARLAVVAAELEDRPVRVYDEAAAQLAPRYRAALVETLREARARGRTCVVATGEAALIAAADRVLRMEDGCLVAVAGGQV
jgi:putative ATP-binding cassette transporter